jgi:hypothetical protein
MFVAFKFVILALAEISDVDVILVVRTFEDTTLPDVKFVLIISPNVAFIDKISLPRKFPVDIFDVYRFDILDILVIKLVDVKFVTIKFSLELLLKDAPLRIRLPMLAISTTKLLVEILFETRPLVVMFVFKIFVIVL